MLQHVGERLAGMAPRIEARALHDSRDFAAQIGDRVRRARVGRRREQTDDSLFADKMTGGVEALDADVIEINAPVHTRAHVRFGDDKRALLLQEGHDLRRVIHQRVAAPQDFQIAVAHHAERGIEIRRQTAALHRVIAHAEKSEIVGQQPVHNLDGFRGLLDRQRRRVRFQFGNDGVDAREHRPPVSDCAPHFGQHVLDSAGKRGASRLVVHAVDVQVDEAFPRAFRVEPRQPAPVARHAQHRMRDQGHGEPPLRQLAQHRVEQKRHIVVDRFQHGRAAALGRLVQRDRRATHFCVPRLTLAQKRISARGKHREVVGCIVQKVLGYGLVEQLGEEVRRRVGVDPQQQRLRFAEQRVGGAVIVHARQRCGHSQVLVPWITRPDNESSGVVDRL